jgi:bifunctional DNA-binding transcriptional regulator/antitoxin component of YhaV-PrlF toxin-antitoxin module
MDKPVKVRRRRGFTRVSPKHQVTIPVEALARAGVHVGDPLRVEARANGEIVLTREEDPLERYAGSLTGLYPPGELEQLRSEWD